LDQIVDRIDDAFGEELPFSERVLEDVDREVLGRVFGDRGYQLYLQDQVSRQIIRDYLTNAVVLGHLPEPALDKLSQNLGTRDGRSLLSLHMLMSSVEQAGELSGGDDQEGLKALDPAPHTPPYIRLVQT